MLLLWYIIKASKGRENLTMTKEMELFTKAIEDYIHNHEAIGTSEHTVRAYKTHLYRFRDFLIENGLGDNAPDKTAVKAWRDSLLESGLKATSVKRYIADVGIFFGKAIDDETLDISVNPVTKGMIPRTKAEERRPYSKKLTPDQVAMLYRNNMPVGYKACLWERNYALVVLLLTSGLRNEEAASLTLRDIDFEHKEIIVRHGKGDKVRFPELSPIAETALKLYLTSGFRPESAGLDEPLFGSMYGGAWRGMVTRNILYTVNTHVRLVTGVDNLRCHDLRHICARDDLNAGMGIEELATKLGHAQITTTQRYCGKLEHRRQRSEISRIFEEQRIQTQRNRYLLGEI